MGKPSPVPLPSPQPQADAISLHSQLGQEYHDDEDSAQLLRPEDLPPLYSDLEEGSSSASTTLLPPQSRTLPSVPNQPNAAWLAQSFSRDPNHGTEYYLDPQLSSDASYLEKHLAYWAAVPPRQFVRIYGWHMESHINNGKKERRRVTDFDVWADLTPYLYRDAPSGQSWRVLRAVTNAENARRGTVFRGRGPTGAGGISSSSDGQDPTLQEWCHRFCASSAGLRCFRLERRVVGLDTALLQQRLATIRQSTNYRGHFEVSFPVRDAAVEVYNGCRTNAWRLTGWVVWLCYLTLMFLFTWPYLFFRTRRFEVAVAEWPFSRFEAAGGASSGREYVSFSEDQWYGLWGRVLHNAVLEKRQGTVEPQEIAELDRRGRPSFNTGQPAVDGVLGFVAASVAAFGEVNRQGGWGHDTTT